ncbi:MAG: LysE family transporter [Candidatus Geothermarchaeales archaeon]
MILETLFIFGTSLVVGFSGALMPGPLLTVTIDEASRRGFKNGALVPFGHAALEFGIVALLVMGLSEILQMGIVAGSVGLLGGIFLLWMGYTILRDALRGRLSMASAGEDVRWKLGPLASGVLSSLSNPYWLLWWATVGSAYLVISAKYGFTGILTFYFGHILSDLSWYGFVAYTIAYGRRMLGDNVYKGILGVCGAFLLALGVYFLQYGAVTLL